MDPRKRKNYIKWPCSGAPCSDLQSCQTHTYIYIRILGAKTVSGPYNMKRSQRRRGRISPHRSKPVEVQNNPEDDLWYFPPIREFGTCTPPRSTHQPSLHNNQPAEVQNNPEDDLWYFPPIKEHESTPPTHRPSQMQNDYEADDSDFPTVKKRNTRPCTPPLHARSHQGRPQAASKSSQRLRASGSGEEFSQPQHRQRRSEGLGEANILNRVETLEQRAKVFPYTNSRQLH